MATSEHAANVQQAYVLLLITATFLILTCLSCTTVSSEHRVCVIYNTLGAALLDATAQGFQAISWLSLRACDFCIPPVSFKSCI